MTTGEKIAKVRKENNFTQEQLAEIMGVTRQSVSRWESDLVYPEMEKIIKLANVLHLSCDYLLKEELSEDQAIPAVTAATRLLQNAIGRKARLQLTEDDYDLVLPCIITEFDGLWAKVQYPKGKSYQHKLIPISSITSISFQEEV